MLQYVYPPCEADETAFTAGKPVEVTENESHYNDERWQALDIAGENESHTTSSSPLHHATVPQIRISNTDNPKNQILSPSEWNVEEVAEWLKSNGFGPDIYERFVEQEISGDVLLALDTGLIETELGISTFGKRTRIANAIAELRRSLSTQTSQPSQGVSLSTLGAISTQLAPSTSDGTLSDAQYRGETAEEHHDAVDQHLSSSWQQQSHLHGRSADLLSPDNQENPKLTTDANDHIPLTSVPLNPSSQPMKLDSKEKSNMSFRSIAMRRQEVETDRISIFGSSFTPIRPGAPRSGRKLPHSLPSLARTRMILFGEKGVGKTSVVNLIAGRPILHGSRKPQETCTMSFQPCNFSGFQIWETVGLEQPRIDTSDNYLGAMEQAFKLVREVMGFGGVHFLLFCIRAGGVNATMRSNYKLFYEILCKSSIPIMLVVTHTEDADSENWWERQKETLEKDGFRFTGHACVTGLPTHSKYNESRAAIQRLLSKFEKDREPFTMEPEEWLVQFLRHFGCFAPLAKGPKREDIMHHLTTRCGLETKIAEELSRALGCSLNVILFGETGVGKSSVINLIAGRPVAETSPDVLGCTMSFKPYQFTVRNRDILIWDTIGLEEPTTGSVGFLPAIINTFDLIQDLTSHGGVDLLLFCIRGNRITATTQSNYRLFYEVLCRSKVPIALVITHLEREENMEDWWTRNVVDLENKYGIKSAGHACVSGLPMHRRYLDSRHHIETLLEGHDGKGTFNMLPEQWFIEFLRFFGLFAPLRERAKRKEVMSVLTKRCRLDPKTAGELSDILQGNAPKSSNTYENVGEQRDRNLTSEIRRTDPPARRGDTWQCDWMKGTTPRKVAVKVIIGLNAQKKYRVDVKLRALLSSRSDDTSKIVPMLGIVDEPLPGLVTPWYNNGSLTDYLTGHPTLSLDEKRGLLRDVLIGLRYLHNQEVVHGNLHSNNVLIRDDGTACLADFSFTLPHKFVGISWIRNSDTLRFSDPKLALRAMSGPDHIVSPTTACDVYSFGGIMLHVMFGVQPWAGLETLDVLEKLLREERPQVPENVDRSIPGGYAVQIQQCWEKEEFRRPSVKDFMSQFGFR